MVNDSQHGLKSARIDGVSLASRPVIRRRIPAGAERSWSEDFPNTLDAYDSSYNRDRDAFVAKLNDALEDTDGDEVANGSDPLDPNSLASESEAMRSL